MGITGRSIHDNVLDNKLDGESLLGPHCPEGAVLGGGQHPGQVIGDNFDGGLVGADYLLGEGQLSGQAETLTTVFGIGVEVEHVTAAGGELVGDEFAGGGVHNAGGGLAADTVTENGRNENLCRNF